MSEKYTISANGYHFFEGWVLDCFGDETWGIEIVNGNGETVKELAGANPSYVREKANKWATEN